jgi:asparagine synthase (glutamine-hydrolysing)
LEHRGYEFISHSDTEVLAHGFAEWGADGLLDRVDGMYATAILDREARELHLARDRFGEKPLFYTQAKGRFAYGSNLLALATLDWVSDELDPQSIDHYLGLHYVPGDATIFKAIKRVLPGERLVVSLADPVARRYRYYQPRLKTQQKISDEDLRSLIEDAVESRLVADVPVGVFLSGGLDSSVIAAVAARKHPGIATFSMGFSSVSHDESKYAQMVANQIGSQHHHFRFQEDSFRSLLPEVAAALDEPVGDQAQLPLYWLSREARRHVTVALSGEGADEIFGGYNYYQNHQPTTWSDRLFSRGARARRGITESQRLMDNLEPFTPSGFPLLTDRNGRQRLTGAASGEMDAWETGLFEWLNQTNDSMRRSMATDIATWLPDDLLVKLDRMSMAHSLESRVPYLAPRLLEAALSLPAAEKMEHGRSKVALRRVARRWLPRDLLERPKQGFVLPMASWLAQWFQERASVREYFLVRAVPGLDMNAVSRLVQDDIAVGVRNERLVFALVLLVEWYQSFKSKQNDLSRRYREATAALTATASTR